MGTRTQTRNIIQRKTQRTRLKEVQVEGLYQKLAEVTCQTPEAFHFDDLELRDEELYHKYKSMLLTIAGGGGGGGEAKMG